MMVVHIKVEGYKWLEKMMVKNTGTLKKTPFIKMKENMEMQKEAIKRRDEEIHRTGNDIIWIDWRIHP